MLMATIIGWERASKRHSAGLRTFILVTIASTAGMQLDCFLYPTGSTPFFFIPAALLIGTSSICVNSLLFSSKNQIRGLTTAAALWCCCVIGLCIGAGFYTAGILLFLLLLPSLALLPQFETYLKNRSNHFEIHLEMKDRRDLPNFIKTLRELGLRIDDIESNPAYMNSGLSVFSIALTITGKELKKYKTHAEIIEVLGTIEYISHVEELK